MPKVINPLKKKVKQEICERMLSLSHTAQGAFCDYMEISPITYKHNFTNNTATLQKARWQAAIKRTLSIPVNKDINEDI